MHREATSSRANFPPMTSRRSALLWINALGGTAVLASYAYGFIVHPDTVGLMWGGVPESWRGLYTTAMFPAAIGYFPMTFFLLFRTDLEQPTRLGPQLGTALGALYCAIMISSALWMPMTFAYIAQPSAALWAGICFVLALVGVSALCIIALLDPTTTRPAWCRLEARPPGFALLRVPDRRIGCRDLAIALRRLRASSKFSPELRAAGAATQRGLVGKNVEAHRRVLDAGDFNWMGFSKNDSVTTAKNSAGLVAP